MTELKTQQMIAEAVSEKEAIEMKEMKPTESNPNDTALSHKESVIPPIASSAPKQEMPKNELPLEEKVEMPSQGALSEVVLSDGVLASAELETVK